MGSKTQAVEVRWKEYIDSKLLTASVLGMDWVSLQLNDSLSPPEFYWVSPGTMGSKTQAVEVRLKKYMDSKGLTSAMLSMDWVLLRLND